MKNYNRAMDRVVLSEEADARIYNEILQASIQQNKENSKKMVFSNRRFTKVMLTAVLVLALAVTAYAAGSRIVMKLQGNDSNVSVNYGTVDNDFISLGNWLPTALPDGYEIDFVSDPFYGEQNVVYTNTAGSTIRYSYAKAGSFDETYLENILSQQDVQIGGSAGKLFNQSTTRNLFWTNDLAGIGFALYTDDLNVDLVAVAESVAESDTALVPTFRQEAETAVSELGDYTPVVPEDYASVSVTGAPVGDGWYGYVRKTFTDESANKTIFLSYETYAADDGSVMTADQVLATFNVSGKPVTVSGMPGILSDSGDMIFWADTANSLRFTLTADAIHGDALLELANSIY